MMMNFSQTQTHAAQGQQQQQQQQYADLALGSGPFSTQPVSAATSTWFTSDVNMQPNIQVSASDGLDNFTSWTPSYASVGGDGFASAYSASLADIAEENNCNFGLGGMSGAGSGNGVAYDPLISDTYDNPQLNPNVGLTGQVGTSTGGGGGVDFSALLSSHVGWSPSAQGGMDARGKQSSDAGQSMSYMTADGSPADSAMSPDASSTSGRPGSPKGTGAGTSSLFPPEFVASWARSGSFGQDNLNTALNQVHISDDTRYQPVFADESDASTQQTRDAAPVGRRDQLRASLPVLNTSFADMAMDVDKKGPNSADIAAALAAWASTAGGLPSPAAAEAIQRAAAFGDALTGADSGASTSGKQNLTLQTNFQKSADKGTLSAKLRDLTPVDGTFDRRSLAQPMRNESFEKIKFLINEGRVFSPTSASGTGSGTLPATSLPPSGLSNDQTASLVDSDEKRTPKDVFVQLFGSTGLDPVQSELAFDHLQQLAQGGKEADQAQRHLATLGVISKGLGWGDLSTDQWEALGLKGFDEQQLMAAAAAVMGQDLTVMPVRYGVATSDTRTQIGDGSSATEDATMASTRQNGGQTLDPSMLVETSRDSSSGLMRPRNWSSSGRGRPFGALGGSGTDAVRAQGTGAETGPSFLGGSIAHPYAPADPRRSPGDQRRHRRSAKSEDIMRMAQEGTADYVHRITSSNGMLAPPLVNGAPGPSTGTSLSPIPSIVATFATAPGVTAQYQASPQLVPSLAPSTVSDGTPSLDGSRSGGSTSAAGSPATTWNGSPSGGTGQAGVNNAATQPSFANMHALASSAAAQRVAAAQVGGLMPVQGQLSSFMPTAPVTLHSAQYSQTAAPMYAHLVPASKGTHAGMLPSDALAGGGAGMAHLGFGPGMGIGTTGPLPGPANHVSVATQVASAARRKTEATFECPVPGCGSTFTRKNNLDGHLRSHNNERPFACPVPGCDKRFARRHDMNRHHDLHLNKKQHVCELCNRRFARLDALNRHLKNTNGTCAAMAGHGEEGEGEGEGRGGDGDGDGDEDEDEALSKPRPVPSSTATSTTREESGSGKQPAGLVAEPTSTVTSAGVEVAISAPTPGFQGGDADDAGGAADKAHVQIPILVTPSRQNSGASSGGRGGGGSSSRFRGLAL